MRTLVKRILMNRPTALRPKGKPRRLTFERLEPRQMLSGDALYFTKDVLAGNDRLIKVDQLARGLGVVSLATQPGYQNVDTGDPGLNSRVIDAAYVTDQRVVAIGGNLVQSYDGSNINNLFGAAWDPDGAPIAGVDAIAIGDFGALTDQIVISRETAPDANDVFVLSTSALNPGSSVVVAGGPTSGGIAHGLVLGDFQPANPGNEALIGFTNTAAAGGNGHQLFYTASGNSGQFFINRPISDVAAGDLNGSGNIDYVLTGLNSAGAVGFGQGSRVFEANGASGNLKSSPGLSGPHNPPWFNAVTIGNLDADADNEIALAGKDFVRVLDNNGAGGFDVLPPHLLPLREDGEELRRHVENGIHPAIPTIYRSVTLLRQSLVLVVDGRILAEHEADRPVVHWHHSFLTAVACAEYGVASGDRKFLAFGVTAFQQALTLGSRRVGTVAMASAASSAASVAEPAGIWSVSHVGDLGLVVVAGLHSA